MRRPLDSTSPATRYRRPSPRHSATASEQAITMADACVPAAVASSPALCNAAAQHAAALVVTRVAASGDTAVVVQPPGAATAPAQLAQLAPSPVVPPGSPGRLLPTHTLTALATAGVRSPGEDDAPSLGLPCLPFALQAEVLQHVPPDQTLLLNRVSPAFKAVVDQPELWRDVKLGVGSGVGRASDALLRSVSAKAGGTMRTLDVSGRTGGDTPAVSVDAVVAACEANTGTLESVDARCEDDPDGSHLYHEDIARLLAAVPQLRRLDADVYCTLAELQALLLHHNGVLRLRRLYVLDLPDAAAVMALVAAVESQTSVSQLGLHQAPLHTAASLDAVVGLSLALPPVPPRSRTPPQERDFYWRHRGLGALRLDDCHLDAASMPALTRLLGREGGLGSLEIDNGFDNPALPPSPAFCAALRASTLQRLVLSGVRLFDDPDAGIALLAASTGHPSLQLLSVKHNIVADAHHAAVGAALGVLVASSAPSLTSLDVFHCELGDAGLTPLVAALAGNMALHSLDIGGNRITRPLGVALLAAVGANTGLRKLEASEVEEWDEEDENEEEKNEEEGQGVEWPEIAEAKALVAARG